MFTSKDFSFVYLCWSHACCLRPGIAPQRNFSAVFFSLIFTNQAWVFVYAFVSVFCLVAFFVCFFRLKCKKDVLQVWWLHETKSVRKVLNSSSWNWEPTRNFFFLVHTLMNVCSWIWGWIFVVCTGGNFKN